MRVLQIANWRSVAGALQWRRGLRAGLAVGAVMFVCQRMHWPMGWAALGALQVILVDNGGPYRSRLYNILSVLVGGIAAVTLGVVAGSSLPLALGVTLGFCFVVTLARVLSQPLAATSVVNLVSYIVAFGGASHTAAVGVASTEWFLGGGAWAAVVTLGLWTVDPFRPAREAVADVYASLVELAGALPCTGKREGEKAFNEMLPALRVKIDAAHAALAATPARMTARTVRARNLTVLVETADLVLARMLQFAELGATREIGAWLTESLKPMEPALRVKPTQGVAGFSPEGSLSQEMRRGEREVEVRLRVRAEVKPQIVGALCDAMLLFETSYEALRAVWTGAESRTLKFGGSPVSAAAGESVMETLRANLTIRSVMFRHALRLAIVVGIDVVLMFLLRPVFNRYTHGYWLAMTSIIVLQPYTGETVKKSFERVSGTVAGGLLAAVVASAVHSQEALIVVIVLGTALSLAVYAVDYAWYCFFLTPTMVLLTMPHLRDWRFAGVRMGMTVLGAVIAVLAMLLLWPERESQQLPGLLARGAAADAAYLRAVVGFWRAVQGRTARQRVDAERALLAPARRLCGLAANDAEETLDHALVEHALPLNPSREKTERLNRAALTFTTYLRRLTQTVTTLAAAEGVTEDVMEAYAARLDVVSRAVERGEGVVAAGRVVEGDPHANEQMRRLERQVGVLERTAGELVGR